MGHGVGDKYPSEISLRYDSDTDLVTNCKLGIKLVNLRKSVKEWDGLNFEYAKELYS